MELNLINNGNTFVNGNNPNGSSCDDNSENTINDMYNNSICVGTYRSGNCDDGNIETIADIYNTEGICVGENVQGKPCNDNNVETVNDVYNSGVCNGLSTPNGTICDDNDVNTLNDVWFNGICKGKTVVQKSTCVNAYVGSEWADARTSGLAMYSGTLQSTTGYEYLQIVNTTTNTCANNLSGQSKSGFGLCIK